MSPRPPRPPLPCPGPAARAALALLPLVAACAGGRETADCYAVGSGLLLGSWTTQASPMGTVAIETRVGEWRAFGALRTATVLRQRAMGQEQVLRVERMEYDGADDAAAFAPPPAVRTMLDARGAR